MNRFSLKIITILFFLLMFGCSDKSIINKKNIGKLLPASKSELMEIDTGLIAQRAREFVIAGSTLQMQNKHAEAILDFQVALRYDSSSAILYSIAKSYYALNRNELAAEYLIKSIEIDSDFLPALELLAQIYVSKYDYSKAAEILEKILIKENTLARRQYLAKIYEYTTPQKAIEVYEGIIRDYQNIAAFRNLTNLYKLYKPKSEYIQLLERLQTINPTNTQNAFEVLDYYTKERDFDKTLNFLKKLDSTLPSSEIYQCYNIIGNRLYDDTLSSQKSISQFLSMIDSRFYYEWRLHMLCAFLADRIKDSNLVDFHFEHTLKVADTLSDLPIRIAMYYSSNKKDSIALQILVNNSQKYPQDKRYPFLIGLNYLNLERNKDAISFFHKALEMDSTFVDPLTHLGLIYDRLKIPDSSDFYYMKALDFDPNNILANNNYAYSLSERGIKLEEALSRSKIALSANPFNPSYLDTYAWINFKMGNYEIALNYINKAVATGEVNSELFEHLGDILTKLKKDNEAQTAFKQALTLEPNRKSVLEKIKR